MARAKIGDIIEIQTPKGFAYAQYTHNYIKPPRYGQLVHVLEGLYEKRQENLSEIASSPTLFAVFFPLNAAIKIGIFEIVGNAPILSERNIFPTFRIMGLVDPITKKASRWSLWDGSEEKVALNHGLTDEQKRMPILETINDSLLIERIMNNWRPELDIHT